MKASKALATSSIKCYKIGVSQRNTAKRELRTAVMVQKRHIETARSNTCEWPYFRLSYKVPSALVRRTRKMPENNQHVAKKNQHQKLTIQARLCDDEDKLYGIQSGRGHGTGVRRIAAGRSKLYTPTSAAFVSTVGHCVRRSFRGKTSDELLIVLSRVSWGLMLGVEGCTGLHCGSSMP